MSANKIFQIKDDKEVVITLEKVSELIKNGVGYKLLLWNDCGVKLKIK